jgi:DNA-binding sugar fermentation-stimulating protein
VVIRDGAVSVRANREACLSFVRYLRQAKKQGVQVLAKRAAWGNHQDGIGNCYDDVMLPIDWDT